MSDITYQEALAAAVAREIDAGVLPDWSHLGASFVRGIADAITSFLDVVAAPIGTRAYLCGAGWVAWHAGRWRPVVRAKNGLLLWAG